jgi:hypothetical protein
MSFIQRIRQSPTLILYGEGILSSLPTQAVGPPSVDYLLLFTQYIRSWRQLLHPQPEDAPWCGDMGMYIRAVHVSKQELAQNRRY